MILLYIHPITLEILSLRYCIVTFSRKVTGRNQAANPSVTCWIRSFRRSLRCPESHESMVQIHECLIVVGAQISSLSCICRECRFVCLKHLLFFSRFFHRLPHLGRSWPKNNRKQFWRFSNGNVGKKIYSNLYNLTTRTSLGKSAYGPMIVSWFFIPDFRSKKRPKKDVRGRWRSRGAWICARIPKWRKKRILSRRILQG